MPAAPDLARPCEATGRAHEAADGDDCMTDLLRGVRSAGDPARPASQRLVVAGALEAEHACARSHAPHQSLADEAVTA